MGEFDLISRFFDRGPARVAELGIGDDCALLGRIAAGSRLAVTTDMLVGGRHFLLDADPAGIGHKTLAVNLSDLAAMGAKPVGFTLAIALPDPDETWLRGFSGGLLELADRFGCELLGGDTTRGPLNLCVTAFGEVPAQAALRRDLAQPGDDLWVSGELGGAAFALGELLGGAGRLLAPSVRARLERPEPRVELGIALRHLARAAIDLSDGLVQDLGHLCERSRVGAVIDWPSIPLDAAMRKLEAGRQQALSLSGGDDYELVFTAAPENRRTIEALSGRHGPGLTRIGRIEAGERVRIVDARGAPVVLPVGGFDHFA
jgi:thiamine-monophosphate kinase